MVTIVTLALSDYRLCVQGNRGQPGGIGANGPRGPQVSSTPLDLLNCLLH